MNVLPYFKGVLVHDAWSSYFLLSAQHALSWAERHLPGLPACNTHLMRELRGVYKHHAQS